MEMNSLKHSLPSLVCTGTIFLLLVITSLFDIVLVFFYPRFYSNALFITTFGIGGVFAGIFGFMNGIKYAVKKNEFARWTLISTLIAWGFLFFFLLSKLEGGEYGPAFKAFGITVALSSLLFVKGKID